MSIYTQRNTRLRGQLLYAASLSSLFGNAGWFSAARDVTVMLRGDYLRSLSNLENYAYENWTAALLFSKELEF